MSEHVATAVLDCEGLSAWVAEDRKAMALIRRFHALGAELVVGVNTIVEASHARVNLPRLQWVLSRVRVEPVTEQSARAAARLLKSAGWRGHKYAIDATVAEAALRQPGPVVMLTSDLDGMTRLCGDRVGLIGL